MIVKEDKIYITKQISSITCTYTEQNILTKLLMQFCFGSQTTSTTLRGLLKEVNNYANSNTYPMPLKTAIKLNDLITVFLANCSYEDNYALLFWCLNKKYMEYLGNEDLTESKNYEEDFGKILNHKLENPKDTNLNNDLLEELETLLINFSLKFNFSNNISNYKISETIHQYFK